MPNFRPINFLHRERFSIDLFLFQSSRENDPTSIHILHPERRIKVSLLKEVRKKKVILEQNFLRVGY
jgi:hypothetical protein